MCSGVMSSWEEFQVENVKIITLDAILFLIEPSNAEGWRGP